MKLPRIEKNRPIYLREEFRNPKGQKKMWDMIAAKIVEAFRVPNYIHYHTYMYTQATYDITIQSNINYQFKVKLDEDIIVSVIDVHSSSTPTKCFEYTGGQLFEIPV